ncbi:Hypothetical protein POVR2_LOCUS290 [uncultured virus]|nr:Hypothetical protein POVR2_LOCUS290 [uncultured virus]
MMSLTQPGKMLIKLHLDDLGSTIFDLYIGSVILDSEDDRELWRNIVQFYYKNPLVEFKLFETCARGFVGDVRWKDGSTLSRHITTIQAQRGQSKSSSIDARKMNIAMIVSSSGCSSTSASLKLAPTSLKGRVLSVIDVNKIHINLQLSEKKSLNLILHLEGVKTGLSNDANVRQYLTETFKKEPIVSFRITASTDFEASYVGDIDLDTGVTLSRHILHIQM